MTIRIVAVGRVRDTHYKALIDQYAKRLRAPWDLDVVEVKEAKAAKASDVKKKEGTDLLSHVDKRWVIALEENGKGYSSEAFSKTLEGWMDDGKKPAFVIGGAHGLSDAVRERANVVMTLSEMTFPHEMARMILVEQVYRAMAIANGSPYHK